VGQLLKVLPGFVRPIEGFFAAAALDHIPDGPSALSAHSAIFDVPQFDAV